MLNVELKQEEYEALLSENPISSSDADQDENALVDISAQDQEPESDETNAMEQGLPSTNVKDSTLWMSRILSNLIDQNDSWNTGLLCCYISFFISIFLSILNLYFHSFRLKRIESLKVLIFSFGHTYL